MVNQLFPEKPDSYDRITLFPDHPKLDILLSLTFESAHQPYNLLVSFQHFSFNKRESLVFSLCSPSNIVDNFIFSVSDDFILKAKGIASNLFEDLQSGDQDRRSNALSDLNDWASELLANFLNVEAPNEG